ncbi:hypothetical protein PF010_g11782 [Phytophthora fragariae]|uniref:Secreted protein n=1 Tax=Phytophthora fragariae TaxID=53985 RepID=A0A6G0L4P6_9STRA|nr:hypothetical protein PF010_g11782 [Phytophthora fragariae]
MVGWSLAALLLGLSIDNVGVHNCHIDEAQKNRLVVLAEHHSHLQRVALQAELVVNVHPLHPALVVAHHGWTGDNNLPPTSQASL